MSRSGDSSDQYSARAQRFEQKKCQLKCQLNTMVDDMFDFFLNEVTAAAAAATANGEPESRYPMTSSGWTMSSGDSGNYGGSLNGYFPLKVELTEDDTTEMSLPAAVAAAFGCELPDGSSLKSEAKDTANYNIMNHNYQTLNLQPQPSTSSSSAAVVAAVTGFVANGNYNNTGGYDDDDETSNEDEDNNNVIVHSVKCFTCEEMFENCGQLDAHAFSVHKYRPRRCLVIGCAASYDDGRSLKKHIRAKHSNKTEFNCTRCPLEFPTHAKLEAHFWASHKMGRFGCAIRGCKFIANKRFVVQKHVDTRHIKIVPPLQKNSTGTGTNKKNNKSNLKKRGNKSKKESNSIMCDYPGCTTVLSSPYNYRRHQRVHTGVRPYICNYPTCEGASFKEKDHCISHIREVHLNLPRYKCHMDEDELVNAQDGLEYLVIQHELLE